MFPKGFSEAFSHGPFPAHVGRNTILQDSAQHHAVCAFSREFSALVATVRPPFGNSYEANSNYQSLDFPRKSLWKRLFVPGRHKNPQNGNVDAIEIGKNSRAPYQVRQIKKGEDGMKEQTVRLGPREQQIVELLLQGCDNAEIASQLNMARRTVKAHFNRLFLRFGITGGIKRVKLATLLYRRQTCLQPNVMETVSQVSVSTESSSSLPKA